MEKYITIGRYDSRYSISNLGNVISHIGKDKELVKLNTANGYLFVRLSKDGKANTEFIHRLVAEHFLDNSDNLPQVDHIDFNKKNNNVQNLQWITAKENNRKSKSKKVIQKSRCGKFKIKMWDGLGHIQESLGFNKSNIQKCCKGKKPTMYGFKWEYV
jgi:hypothetical protein